MHPASPLLPPESESLPLLIWTYFLGISGRRSDRTTRRQDSHRGYFFPDQWRAEPVITLANGDLCEKCPSWGRWPWGGLEVALGELGSGWDTYLFFPFCLVMPLSFFPHFCFHPLVCRWFSQHFSSYGSCVGNLCRAVVITTACMVLTESLEGRMSAKVTLRYLRWRKAIWASRLCSGRVYRTNTRFLTSRRLPGHVHWRSFQEADVQLSRFWSRSLLYKCELSV